VINAIIELQFGGLTAPVSFEHYLAILDYNQKILELD